MEKLGIEYVCFANNGRSPMAEIIGKDYITQFSLEEKIWVYSSGVMAESLKNLNLPAEEIKWIIRGGLKSGSYKGEMKDLAEKCVKKGGLKKELRYCIDYLVKVEETFRNMVLLEVGLVPKGRFRRQTKARDDVQLIISMDERIAKKAQKIYERAGLSPEITTVKDYIGLDLPNAFGKDLAAYRKVRDDIGRAVKISIDRFVEEYAGR
jgi:protein-tyrosine-phosphatase